MKAKIALGVIALTAFSLFMAGEGRNYTCPTDFPEEQKISSLPCYNSSGHRIGNGGSFAVRVGKSGMYRTILTKVFIKFFIDANTSLLHINPYAFESLKYENVHFFGTQYPMVTSGEWFNLTLGSYEVTEKDLFVGIDFATYPVAQLYYLSTSEAEYEPKRMFQANGGKTPDNFTKDFTEIWDKGEISICPVYEQNNCGNNIFNEDEGEECEPPNQNGCSDKCICERNLKGVNGTCRGCGNDIIEDGEFCDGEEWCNIDCKSCGNKYIRLGNSCFLKSKFIAIIVCCILALIIIIVAPIVVCVLYHKYSEKKGSSTLESMSEDHLGKLAMMSQSEGDNLAPAPVYDDGDDEAKGGNGGGVEMTPVSSNMNSGMNMNMNGMNSMGMNSMGMNSMGMGMNSMGMTGGMGMNSMGMTGGMGMNSMGMTGGMGMNSMGMTGGMGMDMNGMNSMGMTGGMGMNSMEMNNMMDTSEPAPVYDDS